MSEYLYIIGCVCNNVAFKQWMLCYSNLLNSGDRIYCLANCTTAQGMYHFTVRYRNSLVKVREVIM
jgi:hypothetical protein